MARMGGLENGKHGRQAQVTTNNNVCFNAQAFFGLLSCLFNNENSFSSGHMPAEKMIGREQMTQ